MRRIFREQRLFVGICALVILLSLAYIAGWYANRGRISDEGERYRAMYSPPPIATETPAPSASPTPPPSPTPSPTQSPTASARAIAMSPAPDELLAPLATPDESTLIFALPTNPPAQESFSELLRFNPDTVGFLSVEGAIELPVVQKENDNEYYLTHNFACAEAREGALFLDGANRPGDQNQIVYGHNMKDGTMFGGLSDFGNGEFLRRHAVIRFDTIYENAAYVPFAMFEASMDADSAHYFDVRQIAFDETSLELFVLKLKGRSALELPVDVAFGDELLTLVTCSYADEDGRYIVALRKLRPGEDERQMRDLIAGAL